MRTVVGRYETDFFNLPTTNMFEKISLLLTRKDGFTEIIANITLNKINMLNEKIVHTNRHRTAKYCRYRECQRYVQYQKKYMLINTIKTCREHPQ